MPQINLGSNKVSKTKPSTYLLGALVIALLALGAKIFWLDSKGYLVPTQVIPVGANLAHEEFSVVKMNLGLLGNKYLSAAKKPNGFAQETLRPGVLIPGFQVSAFAPESQARLVVTNKTQLGSGVRAGAKVAIWSARKLASNQFDVPKQLVASARVSKVIKGSAMFGSQAQQVELLIEPVQTPIVLDAMASDSPIFLVAEQ